MKHKQRSNEGRTTASIAAYDAAQSAAEASICKRLRTEIERALRDAASKIWHGAPVWFVGETPVVGYSVPARGGVVLLFWNGQAFGDPALKAMGKVQGGAGRVQSRFRDQSDAAAALAQESRNGALGHTLRSPGARNGPFSRAGVHVERA